MALGHLSQCQEHSHPFHKWGQMMTLLGLLSQTSFLSTAKQWMLQRHLRLTNCLCKSLHTRKSIDVFRNSEFPYILISWTQWGKECVGGFCFFDESYYGPLVFGFFCCFFLIPRLNPGRRQYPPKQARQSLARMTLNKSPTPYLLPFLTYKWNNNSTQPKGLYWGIGSCQVPTPMPGSQPMPSNW